MPGRYGGTTWKPVALATLGLSACSTWIVTVPGPTPSASPVSESILAIRVSALDQRQFSVSMPAGRHSAGPRLASNVTVSPTLTTFVRTVIGAKSTKQLSLVSVPLPQASSRRMKADIESAVGFDKLKWTSIPVGCLTDRASAPATSSPAQSNVP